MISDRTRRSFDRGLEWAMRSALPGPGQAVVEFQPLGTATEAQADRSILISITSYALRVITCLHCATDAPTVAHLAAQCGEPVEAFDAGRVAETLAERANLLSGVVSRELGAVFPHRGMSTPYTLPIRCLDHMGLISPLHEAHRRILLSDGVRFEVSLYVCSRDPLDFELDCSGQHETDVASGELELL